MIDEAFQDQAIALKQAGFGTSTFSIEKNRITGAVPEGATLVYRGWMMSETEYAFFYGWMMGKGLKPLIDVEQYVATHYLPNWVGLIERMTPATNILDMSVYEHGLPPIDTVVAEINAMGFQKVFVKDFVKSLKTKDRPPIFECPVKVEDFKALLEDMAKYRGKIEGGLVVREYENFYARSETRYFVINGSYYGQEMMFDTRAMSLLMRVAKEIPSPFFSVDIAERTDGAFRVVEIGDGQVSDLVGWTEQRFADIWRNL
jgi:hypothetical protein